MKGKHMSWVVNENLSNCEWLILLSELKAAEQKLLSSHHQVVILIKLLKYLSGLGKLNSSLVLLEVISFLWQYLAQVWTAKGKDVRSSLAGSRNVPLFLFGICYLKNVQIISFSKECCSKWTKSQKPEKKPSRLFLQIKTSFQEGCSSPLIILVTSVELSLVLLCPSWTGEPRPRHNKYSVCGLNRTK